MGKPKFELDDLVRLKSKGSPQMCIEEIIMEGKYKCVWFVGTKYHSQIFLEHNLEIWEDEPTVADMMIAPDAG